MNKIEKIIHLRTQDFGFVRMHCATAFAAKCNLSSKVSSLSSRLTVNCTAFTFGGYYE